MTLNSQHQVNKNIDMQKNEKTNCFWLMSFLCVQEGLERVLPDDIHSVANHRLHISLTRASDRSNIIVR